MRQLDIMEFLEFLESLDKEREAEQVNTELNSVNPPPYEQPTDFSWALRQIKAGSWLARKSWNGPNQYIATAAPKSSHFLYISDEYTKVVTDNQYLVLFNGTSYQPGWVPSQGDLFADDWYIVGSD